MKNLRPNTFAAYLKLTVGMIIIIAVVFSIYIWSEKQIDQANNLRIQSFQLTDELRQSSDDLTRMVRTYVATGNPTYKKYYQDIIDIRNGKMLRPKNYNQVYWDFVLAGEIPENIDTTPAVALLDLMKQANFPEQELQKLANSKAHSDKLTGIEFEAMRLFEASSTDGKSKAHSMLYNDNYHLAKADIMRPINEVTSLMDQRTSTAVSHAKEMAIILLIIFVGFVLGLIFTLLRLYSLLNSQLGGTLSKVQHEIAKIGSADFTSVINVPAGKESSVMGWLAKTQAKLITLEHQRKLAEESSQAALDKLQKVARLVPGVVYQYHLNLDGKSSFPFASDAIKEIYKVRPEEVREDASKVLEILHPDDLENIITSIQQSAQELTLWHCEYRVKFNDGTVNWLLGNAMPEREADGSTLWHGFITDITKRKQDEAALKEKEERLALATSHNGIGIWDFNLLTQSLVCDDLTLSFYNRKREDFNNSVETWMGWLHPDDLASSYQVIQDAISEKRPFNHQFRSMWPNGEIRYIQAKAQIFYDVSGKPLRMIGTNIDITKEKQIEQALRKSESQINTLVNSIPDLVWLKDASGVYLFCNPTFEKFFDIKEADIIGKSDYDFVDKKTADCFRENDRRAMLAGQSSVNEEELTFASGSYHGQFETIKTPMLNEEGKPIGVLGIARDITERKLAERALYESQKRYQELLDGVGEKFIIYSHNLSGELLYVSDGVENVIGFPKEFVIGKNWGTLINWLPGILEQAQDKIIQLATGVVDFVQHEMPFTYLDGSIRTLHVSSHAVRNQDGEVLSIDGIVENITERKQSEKDLRIAAAAFESQEGMFVTDANKAILRVNIAFTTITGYSAEEVIGKTPQLLSSGKQSKEFYTAMWKSIHNTGAWKGEIWNRRKSGDIYPEQLTITAVKDATGITTNYVATLTDITKSKAAVNEIKNLAFYDPLTKLPNRRLVLERLAHALSASTRTGQYGALLFLDLDNFKTLNDTLGHNFGDLLLQQTAERLNNCLRKSDTASRIGGDEFVVLLEALGNQDMDAATQAEATGYKILDALNAPYELDTHTYNSSSSIGITLFDKRHMKPEELLKQADIAMYQAKHEGRNALCFFEPKMQEVIHARAELEKSLRLAIKQQQFELHYQIQVDQAGQALGAEALIRWHHPTRGIVSPFEFIPAAEEMGLIVPIGQWVLETACAQLQTWQQDALTQKLTLSVNVSAKQFSQTDFVEQVKTTVEHYAIDPNLLNLELTESLLLNKVEDTIATMNVLQAIGIHFELDDFGTGYSSLQYLKKLPLHQLKIDRTFINDIVTNASDQAIVSTIIAMAESLMLKVIAEGVETEEQRQRLLNKGCIHYQGYLFSKPVPIEEFEALLRTI